MVLAGIVGFLIVATSCRGTSSARWAADAPSTPSAPSTADLEQENSSSEITLMPGDIIDIKFAYAGQFNETLTVRPDGKVELLLVGEVVARGKAPSELRDELTELYSAHLKYPQLAVIVRALHERRVYVGGEVHKPGLLELPGELSVLEAIMQAGGFDMEKAEPASVMVVRHGKDGRQHGYALDLKSSLDGKEARPFLLQPRDIIYVPRTRIANIDQWISQHLYKLLPPLSVGYGF